MQQSISRPKLGKRVFLALRFGAPMPAEYFDWKMAFDTGWTLEYIRSLPYAEYLNYIEIKDAINKTRNT